MRIGCCQGRELDLQNKKYTASSDADEVVAKVYGFESIIIRNSSNYLNIFKVSHNDFTIRKIEQTRVMRKI